MAPDESRADVTVHGFWKWGTYTLFEIKIVNLDASSYLHHTSAKALAMAEKEKKDKYFQTFLERRRSFTHMVYFTYGIPVQEAVAAQRRLALLLSNNLKL